MHSDGRQSEGLSPLERVLDRCGGSLLGEDGRPQAGASLLAAVACHELSLDADDACVAELAAHLGVTPESFAPVLAFAGAVVDLESPDVLTLCAGMSCSIGGAADYHLRLLEMVGRREGTRESCQVYCLNECGRGPNVMVGKQVYCSGEQTVDQDSRHWRTDTGPVPLGDGGAPVRD